MAAAAKSSVPEFYTILDTKTGTVIDTPIQSAKKLLDEVELSEPEDFFFSTLDGESSVHGFVMPPLGKKIGEKYPAILYIHGGPHPFYTYGLTMEFQLLAAQGFAILYCNPRGSSGYGWVHETYQRSIDGSAYYDLLQFVDEACRRFDFIIGFSLLNCLEFFVFRKMKSSSTINHPLCGCESNVIQKKLPFRVQ